MTRLKSILLTVMAIVVCCTMQAQVADVQEYAQARVSERTFDAMFIGSDGNRVVYVENADTRKKKRTEIVAYDMNRQELERVLLIEGTDTRCYGGFINGPYVDLLMADWKGNDMTLYRYRLDLQSLGVNGERQTLVDYKGTSGDKMGFRLSASPNQQLLAILYYVGRETQPTEVQVGLYSRELEEYWKVDTRCRQARFLTVTDSGEVALGGIGSQGCKITIIDGETEKGYTISNDDLPTSVAEMNLANIANGRIYFVGTHKGMTNYNGGTMVDKLFSICYDTRSNVVYTDWHEISEQERNRVVGLRDDYKIRKPSAEDKCIRFFSLNQTMPDGDGYYAMMDQMWTVTVDGVLNSECRTGQVVMHVDKDGKIEWVRVFRMCQTAPAGARPMIHHRWVATGRGPMLVWAEAKKSAESSEDKPIADYTAFKSSAVLTAAIIDRQGNMVRQHCPMPSKTGIQGCPVLMETGDWLMLLRGKSKGRFATLKLK